MLLLDTHVLLAWLWNRPDLIAQGAVKAVENPAQPVFVSSISAFEIVTKKALGKLTVPDDLEEQIKGHGFTELPFSIAHSAAASKLPAIHRDPFDRMLIAQALTENLILVTGDGDIQKYDVSILKA